MIPYGKQDVTQEDIDAVVDVLKSDFLTQGPVVPAFESEISKKVNSKYAIAVNSATSALHLACLSLDSLKVIFFGQPLYLLLLLQIVVCTVAQKLIL